jgi:hypothetical protein
LFQCLKEVGVNPLEELKYEIWTTEGLCN